MSKMTKYLPYSMYLKEYITFKKDVFLILSQAFNKEKS